MTGWEPLAPDSVGKWLLCGGGATNRPPEGRPGLFGIIRRILSAPPLPPQQWTKTTGRPLRSWRKSLGVWLFAHFVGVPVPWRAVRQADGRSLLAFEHQRLLGLAAAGERVPQVLAYDGDSLVTAHVGTTVDRWLDDLPPEHRQDLMQAAAADLARFHARGHWHGGAQVRNLTWDGAHFARLDFEERLRPGMALTTVQVYDALQLLLSLTRWLEPLGSPAVRAVLQHYHADNPAVDLPGFLRQLLPRLRRVSRLASWVPRYDGSREMRRLRVLLDGMQMFAHATEFRPQTVT